MITKIRTNRLKCSINCDALAEKYDFFYLETSDKYVKRGAYILDAPVLCNDIKALKFESGRKILILMLKSEGNLGKLKLLLNSIDGGDRFAVSRARLEEIQDYILVQLLFNALGAYESEFLKFNNLTGHLYCFHPAWVKHGKDKGTDVIWGLQSLEILISADMCINLPVRSFTSELLKKKITFGKKKFEDYPKYVFSANNTLCRRLSDNKETCFIMRQVDGEKKEIPFMDLQSIEKFERTKMGMLVNVVTFFNQKYEGMVSVCFDEREITDRIDYTRAVQKENASRIYEVLSETGVNIVDQIGDTYSETFCQNVYDLIYKKYGVRASIGKRIKKDALNIALVHNAEYYDGINDPHDKVYDAAVQHITFEDFSDSSEFAIATVIHEVVIKKDLMDKKISLFDWSQMGYDSDISFGMEFEIAEDKRYFFITVHPDGTFEIREQEYTLFEMNEYTELVDIFEQARTDSENVKGIIRFEDGAVNVIKDAGMFTIPKIEKIQELLETGENKLRGQDRREELLASTLDIKMFEIDEEKHYFVGTIGEGMKQSIQRGAVIRKVIGTNGASVEYDKLLNLMNVSFVHNGQLTIVPFPYKYLREFVKSTI